MHVYVLACLSFLMVIFVCMSPRKPEQNLSLALQGCVLLLTRAYSRTCTHNSQTAAQ